MKILIRILTLICLVEIAFLSLSETSVVIAQNFERFSNKEGFNQNTINNITQDKYGFLWFGTPNGLIKYDGYEFETFTTQSKTYDNISSNDVTSLYNDTSGVLWIGTNVGTNLYIPWLERFYTVPIETKLEVSHVAASPNGDVWFSGENKLYACHLINDEKGNVSVSKNLLADHPNILTINDFSFIDDNIMVLATDTGLKKIELGNHSKIEEIKIENISSFEKFDDNDITCVQSIGNIFWIGTTKGLFKTTLDENRIHLIKEINQVDDTKDSSLSLSINTIFESSSGDVWIGTVNNGLLKYLEKEDQFLNYRYDPKNEL